MAAVKATFTLDEESARNLANAARRLNKPKSEIVRRAINQFSPPSGRLSEEERTRALKVFDKYMQGPPTRPQEEVDAEIAEIRDSRRLAGQHRARRLGE